VSIIWAHFIEIEKQNQSSRRIVKKWKTQPRSFIFYRHFRSFFYDSFSTSVLLPEPIIGQLVRSVSIDVLFFDRQTSWLVHHRKIWTLLLNYIYRNVCRRRTLKKPHAHTLTKLFFSFSLPVLLIHPTHSITHSLTSVLFFY